MCDRESFAKLREAIFELQKTDAVQSEQIKTLFNASKTWAAITKMMFGFISLIMLITILALVYGALGSKGFNAVTKSVPAVMQAQQK